MGGDKIVGRGETAARSFLNGVVANQNLQTSRRARHIRNAVGIQRNMTQVPGSADVSAQQAAIHHRGAADASAEREHNDVGVRFARALPDFAQQSGLRIVEDRHGCGRFQVLGPIEACQSLQASRHDCDRASVACRKAGRGKTDARRLVRPLQVIDNRGNL